jgi:hypothetical protein
VYCLFTPSVPTDLPVGWNSRSMVGKGLSRLVSMVYSYSMLGCPRQLLIFFNKISEF